MHRRLFNAGLLLAGLVAGVLVRTPAINAGERASLEVMVLELTRRVAALEARQASPTRVAAPFTVTGKDGKLLLQVVDDIAQAPWAKVTIGGSATGHSVVAVSTDGKVGGAGALLAAEPDGRGNLTIRNAKGEPVVRAAESGTGDGHFAVHDKANRGLFLVTPSLAGASWARVTVGAAAAGMSAIMVSSDGKVGGGGVAIIAENGVNPGTVTIRSSAGKNLAVMSANEGGVFVVRDGAEKTRVRFDKDGLILNDASEKGILQVTEKTSTADANIIVGRNASGGPVVRLKNADGSLEALMGTTGQFVGFSVMAGGAARATLSATNGIGSLEVANASGSNVAASTSSTRGTGYFQLGDAEGNSMVEGGVTPSGLGMLRVYPHGGNPANPLGLPGAVIIGKHQK